MPSWRIKDRILEGAPTAAARRWRERCVVSVQPIRDDVNDSAAWEAACTPFRAHVSRTPLVWVLGLREAFAGIILWVSVRVPSSNLARTIHVQRVPECRWRPPFVRDWGWWRVRVRVWVRGWGWVLHLLLLLLLLLRLLLLLLLLLLLFKRGPIRSLLGRKQAWYVCHVCNEHFRIRWGRLPIQVGQEYAAAYHDFAAAPCSSVAYVRVCCPKGQGFVQVILACSNRDLHGFDLMHVYMQGPCADHQSRGTREDQFPCRVSAQHSLGWLRRIIHGSFGS